MRPTHTDVHPSGPTLTQALTVGALIGVASGVWLVVLQNASAWAASMLWTVASPMANFAIYALPGAVAGGIAGIGAALLHRIFLRRIDGWVWIAAAVGLAAYAARGAVFLARDIGANRGGILGPIILEATVLLGLLALSIRLLGRRGTSGARAAVWHGVCLMIPTLTAGYMWQMIFVGRQFQNLPPFSRPLILVVAGVAGVFVGWALTAQKRGGGLAPARAVGGVLLAALLAGSIAYHWKPRPDPPEAAKPTGPNVLLVVLDTLRQDAVSAYGVVEGTTPRLDAFAAEGTLWEDAIVPGNWTIPGHASLFTGVPVSRHGSGNLRQKLRLTPAGANTIPLPTLAEYFGDHGWTTAAFVCNAQLNTTFGFDRGFQTYQQIWRARKGDFDLLGLVLARLGLGEFDRGGAIATRGLASWFRSRRAKERPWFVFANYTEPHSPYDVPEPWLNQFTTTPISRQEARRIGNATPKFKYGGATQEQIEILWDVYLGATAYQDHLMGEVFEALDDSGMAENTIVIVTSDHGENFGWDGQFLHGVDLNDDLLDVPLIARGPGIPVGVREATPASLIDVFPTLVQLTGVRPLRPEPARRGIVLPPIGPALDGERVRLAERYANYLGDLSEFTEKHPEINPELGEGAAALLVGPWKVISREYGDQFLTRRELEPEIPVTDGRVVVEDAETRDTLLAKLEEILSAWPKAQEPTEGEQPELDEETIQHLRALGYLD